MAPLTGLLIHSTSAPLPPLKALNSPPSHSPPPSSLEINVIKRRDAVIWLSSIVFSSLLQPRPATAISFGISGPKEWLQEQKKKTAKFLLAPVDASRNILQSAYLLLMKNDTDFGENDFQEVHNLLVSASRDCVPRDRSSFVEFQSNTGVEVCTFRLVVKNASSLLDDRDPIKLKAESKLTDLVSSFSSLNGMIGEKGTQLSLDRQRVVDALKDTISSLNNFEQGIKDCLQV